MVVLVPPAKISAGQPHAEGPDREFGGVCWTAGVQLAAAAVDAAARAGCPSPMATQQLVRPPPPVAARVRVVHAVEARRGGLAAPALRRRRCWWPDAFTGQHHRGGRPRRLAGKADGHGHYAAGDAAGRCSDPGPTSRRRHPRQALQCRTETFRASVSAGSRRRTRWGRFAPCRTQPDAQGCQRLSLARCRPSCCGCERAGCRRRMPA